MLSVGKAYILEAATEFWGLQNVNDSPTKHVPPEGILRMSKEVKQEYFDHVIGAFVDEFVIPDPDKENSATGQQADTFNDEELFEESKGQSHPEPDRTRLEQHFISHETHTVHVHRYRYLEYAVKRWSNAYELYHVCSIVTSCHYYRIDEKFMLNRNTQKTYRYDK